MLTSLTISFLTIFNGYISWLTPAFCYSEGVCQKEELTYHGGTDYPITGHRYQLSDGTGWECNVYVYGKGYVFPSERDFTSLSINI